MKQAAFYFLFFSTILYGAAPFPQKVKYKFYLQSPLSEENFAHFKTLLNKQSEDVHQGRPYTKYKKIIKRNVRLYTVNLDQPINEHCTAAIHALLAQQIKEDPSQEACKRADKWQEKRRFKQIKKNQKAKSPHSSHN